MSASKPTPKQKKAKTANNISATPTPATEPEAQPETQPHTPITQRNINHAVTAGPITTTANRIALEKHLDALQRNPTATATQIRQARQQLRAIRNRN